MNQHPEPDAPRLMQEMMREIWQRVAEKPPLDASNIRAMLTDLDARATAVAAEAVALKVALATILAALDISEAGQ